MDMTSERSDSMVPVQSPTAVPAASGPLQPQELRALTVRDQVSRMQRTRELAVRGDQLATQRQHDKGKLTARERLELLLDPGSFVELDLFRRRPSSGPSTGGQPYTDGVVTGSGDIYGRRVFAYAQDFRIQGGSLGETHAAKIHKIMDLAMTVGAPLIAFNDSGGARIQEGVTALAGYGGIFRRNVRASGVIPQISVILGPCAGGAAYSPALTDFVFMVRENTHMFITGPDVVKTVTGETVTHAELGGPGVNGQTSGVATFVSDDEETCLKDVRYLVTFLPANNHEPPPTAGPPFSRTTSASPPPPPTRTPRRPARPRGPGTSPPPIRDFPMTSAR